MEPDAHIFWVHGNLETFKASYLKIRQAVGIAGDDEDLEACLHGVKRWLDSPDSGKWAAVIDNFDDATDLTLNQYLPLTRGTILFTTRDKRLIGSTAYVGARYGVEIQSMSDGEATETLSRLLSSSRAVAESHTGPGSGKHAQLLSLLENFPLAIAQAAAYINNIDMTVSEYLELFTYAQPKLLSKPLMMVGHEEHASRAVMTTWEITLDKIQSTSPTSVRLLELMSIFNPDEIPEELIRGVAFFKDQCPLVFSDALEPLIIFSLVYRLRGSSTFRLHRLVSFWVQTQIQEKQERLQMALNLVFDTIPLDPRDNLRKCLQLKPHAVAVLTYAGSMEFESTISMLVVQRLGDITESEGDYVEALKWYHRALGSMEKALGNNHGTTLGTISNIAMVFQRQGEYIKALEWYKRALDGMREALGNYHPSTLNTVNNIGMVFQDLGEYSEALPWYQWALDGKEKALGNNHPSTLGTFNNIGMLFEDQGEYIKALEWYQRALDGYAKALGTNHPSTLHTQRRIAAVLESKGNFTRSTD